MLVVGLIANSSPVIKQAAPSSIQAARETIFVAMIRPVPDSTRPIARSMHTILSELYVNATGAETNTANPASIREMEVDRS